MIQSFSLDLYSFSGNAPDNGSLDYVRNVMIRHHEVFFIYTQDGTYVKSGLPPVAVT